MSAPIPYTVQSGETLLDIAQKLGIKDWTKLRDYHNANSTTKVGNTPYTGFSLMTPSEEEVYGLNGGTPPPDPVEEQKTAEQKQQEEKKKEEEKKKNTESSKSEHDGKYFVVHNAKCICDQSIPPKKTADLQVTSHAIIVLNDQQGKLAATEEDKTFVPPAETFGKCKLKPSAGGYLPCALAPAPKWNKTYDSTQVMGKNTLTEISELPCMVGGKITIFKHGQTDSVSNAHADNTNPAELAMVNPALDQPKKKEEYPSVTSIALTQIENRMTFKEIDSKTKSEVVYLRKDEEASFKANLKSGNKQLTSWMVYSDHQGKKENRIFLREQIGTEFSQSFEGLGKFRVEGYGKPKTPEFEKGKYDKCDPSCSIDVEVVENTLLDLESTSGDFTTRIDPSKNRKFRKGVPSVFKAKFFIPDLTEEEKSRLTLAVFDGSGNAITDGVHINGDTLTFIPKNTKAKYTIVAQYANEQGEVIEKKMSGESEGNAVLGISHGAEVVRPGTAMSFSVSKMKYKFGDDNSPFGLTAGESSDIKWNLDGVLIGNGKSITIPGVRVTPGKHVVEAYSMVANATGKNAKKEDDDWHFEVKDNDVVSFTVSGTPKVGKPMTATVDKMIFPDLLPSEIVQWQGFSNAVTGKAINFTPKKPGTLTITSKIKGKGSTQTITVVQPIINDIQFTDSNGSKIDKAGWGQKVNIRIDHKGLDNEKLTIVLWDSDTVQDDPVKTITIKAYDGGLIPVTLDADMKNKAGNQGLIYAKISAPDVVAVGEGLPFPKSYKLDVQDKKEIFNAKLGSEDGSEKHTVVDYDEVSYFYANSRGIKPDEVLFLEIRDSVTGRDPLLLQQVNVKADQNGIIKQKIIWNNIKNKVNLLTVYAMIKEKNKDGKVLYDADGDFSMATAKLRKGSTLVKIVENKGAVKVGDEQISGKNENNCPRCEAQITVAQLQQVYTNAKDSKILEQLAAALNKYKKVFKLDTCARKAHFFAQSIQEAGHSLVPGLQGETFNYFKDVLLDPNTDLKAFRTDEGQRIAARYARQTKNGAPIPESNQIILANFAYGPQYKTGKSFKNTGNDGWNFRGRGLLQITGRSNYGDIQEQIKTYASDSGVDILKRYDSSSKTISRDAGHMTPLEAALTGLADWLKDNMYSAADSTGKMPDNDVVDLIVNIINRYTNSRKERKEHYQKTKTVFEVDKCPKVKPVQESPDEKNAIWRNPLDNPQITIYTQGGKKRPWRSAFGRVRTDLPGKDNGKRPHHGLDLFAVIGTPVFACLPGKVVSLSPGTGYGKGLILKVDPKYLDTVRKQRRNYTPYYIKSKRTYNKDEYDILGFGDFDEYEGIKDSEEVYLMYAHLSELDSKLKLHEEITVDNYKTKVLGKTGDTGATGTKGPHLHFEIRSKQNPSGYSERYNPAYYIRYKNETQLSTEERKIQDKTAGK